MGYLARALRLITETHKEDIPINSCFLIDQTLQEINREWKPGTLEWMRRRRPDDWARLIELERQINGEALQKNKEELTKRLTEYKTLIGEMVKAFKTPTGETGSLNFDKGSQDL